MAYFLVHSSLLTTMLAASYFHAYFLGKLKSLGLNFPIIVITQ